MNNRNLSYLIAVLIFLILPVPTFAKAKKIVEKDLRATYIERVQQSSLQQAPERTLGSLWTPIAPLTDIASDFKATRLNDTIIIQVVEQTSAQTNGNSQQNRTLAVNSAITALPGSPNLSAVNPLLGANSGQQLKGAGQIAATSQLQTSLTGQVVSVLPNGNLIVEAQRITSINGQRETMLVRGVARPGDITHGNAILSTQLMDLEVELKGKGLVSDATRGPSIITRLVMKLLGF